MSEVTGSIQALIDEANREVGIVR